MSVNDSCRPQMVQAYADGQLSAAEALVIESHLKICAACSEACRAQRALSGAIGASDLYHKAPDRLRQRLAMALAAQAPIPACAALPPTPRPRQAHAWRSVALAASAFFAVVLSAAIAVRFNPVGRNEILHDVIQSHMRSLILNHLADVPSTDQHTVKPWFNGKIDFSPPVRDLAASGFALSGGRVDVVDNRVVAALVYRRRRHYINLFVWPSDDAPASEFTATRRGYNVIHWNRSGMSYWAVSDLNRPELEQFVSLLNRTAQP